MFYLVYQYNSEIFVSTALSTIVVAETTYLFLDFLLMIAVSSLEAGLGFPHILALAFLYR